MLANYTNLDIRSASVKDVVLSDPVAGEEGRHVVGLRVGKLGDDLAALRSVF